MKLQESNASRSGKGNSQDLFVIKILLHIVELGKGNGRPADIAAVASNRALGFVGLDLGERLKWPRGLKHLRDSSRLNVLDRCQALLNGLDLCQHCARLGQKQ